MPVVQPLRHPFRVCLAGTCILTTMLHRINGAIFFPRGRDARVFSVLHMGPAVVSGRAKLHGIGNNAAWCARGIELRCWPEISVRFRVFENAIPGTCVARSVSLSCRREASRRSPIHYARGQRAACPCPCASISAVIFSYLEAPTFFVLPCRHGRHTCRERCHYSLFFARCFGGIL